MFSRLYRRSTKRCPSPIVTFSRQIRKSSIITMAMSDEANEKVVFVSNNFCCHGLFGKKGSEIIKMNYW